MTALAVVRTPADSRDQAWLDAHVERLADGIEAATAIWANWHQGRNVGRLYPGMTAGDYIESLGHRLTLGEALQVMPNASSREVAKAAGVSFKTVTRARAVSDDTPAAVTGADGKQYPARVVAPIAEETPPIDDALWDALMAAIDALSGLADKDATEVAATVPERRRAATAKRLRKLGTYLGRIAWTLEGQGGQT